MSGVGEAALIIGLVSGVIAIVDGIKKVYDAAGDAEGLPAAFRSVAERLPLIRETLKVVEEQLRTATMDKDSYAAIKSSVERAKVKAEQLDTIFEKCVPSADSSRYDRYVAALRTLGKGHKVEILMKELLESVQDIANHRAITAVTAEHITKLVEAINNVSAIEPSVSDETIDGSGIGKYVHTGTGDLYSAEGHAEQYNAKDNARQYRAETMTFGKD
ncbi:SesA protein [Pyrenochaeta sp. DS3sAY3a]|nr:SesA protein [Pyrenochaeta sp. DS3sAY3a]